MQRGREWPRCEPVKHLAQVIENSFVVDLTTRAVSPRQEKIELA